MGWNTSRIGDRQISIYDGNNWEDYIRKFTDSHRNSETFFDEQFFSKKSELQKLNSHEFSSQKY